MIPTSTSTSFSDASIPASQPDSKSGFLPPLSRGPMPGPGEQHRLSGGFTLIEVLVAASLFLLLAIFVAQMVGSISTGSASSTKRLSADDEARMILDRMQGDFASMVQRADADPEFLEAFGNDSFFFISQSPAFSTNSSTNNSQMALLGYAVTNGGLVRYSMGYGWDQLTFLTNSPGGTYDLSTNVNNTNFVTDLIGPSVFRMEMGLLIKPGSTNISGGTTNIIGTNVFFQSTTNTTNGIRDVAGVVVTLGILDQTSRKIVTPTALSKLESASIFPDCTTNGIPVSTWISNLPAINLPPPAKSQLRIYQRYFPLSQ